MKFLSLLYGTVGNIFARYPSASSGSVVFTLAFSLIAGNALYAQKAVHPAPLWQTYENQKRKAIHKPASLNEHAQRVSKSVLTQSISLSNIPVPTARPALNKVEKINSSLVRDIQSELALLGFYKGKVDGIFGSGTENAIISFQKNAGILPNGEANYTLLTNLKSATSLIKQQNSEHTSEPQVVQKQPRLIVFDEELVSKIQNGLKDQFGEVDIVVDGVMGAQTRSALRNFQQRFKLDVTGEPDDATIDKLISVGILKTI